MARRRFRFPTDLAARFRVVGHAASAAISRRSTMRLARLCLAALLAAGAAQAQNSGVTSPTPTERPGVVREGQQDGTQPSGGAAPLAPGQADPAPAAQPSPAATAPAAPGDAKEALTKDPNVQRSQEPGNTELGRSPPNTLTTDSDIAFQQAIDRAHEGTMGRTQDRGGTRRPPNQPPDLADGSASRPSRAAN
jgi:hypothetical protein